MAEPKHEANLSDTLPATPEGDLFGIRAGLTRDLLEIRTRINEVQDRLALAQYGDPSRLGADRGRITVAARMVTEVGAHVADLAFLPRPEDEEKSSPAKRSDFDPSGMGPL